MYFNEVYIYIYVLCTCMCMSYVHIHVCSMYLCMYVLCTYACMSYVLVYVHALLKSNFKRRPTRTGDLVVDLSYRTAFVAVDCSPHLGRYADDYDITQAQYKVKYPNTTFDDIPGYKHICPKLNRVMNHIRYNNAFNIVSAF